MTILPERRGDHVALFQGIITVSFGEPIGSAWCHYCGRAGANTRDHIVAKSKGGSSQWWNLVPAHRSCNRAKADSPSDCSCGFCARARELHYKRRVR